MEIHQQDGITVIIIDERLDAIMAQKLKDMVILSSNEGKNRLVIDLGKTRFIDSSGCGALVASLRVLLKKDGVMKIANPSSQALSLFQLTRLDRVFEIFPDVDAAVASFQ
jgi:anti-sigma B factor antagonist